MLRAAFASLLVLLVLAAPAMARDGAVELGAAVNDTPLLTEPAGYLDTLDDHYDAVVPESAMNIFVVQPEEGTWDFSMADAHVAWARDHGKQLHAIPLIWCADNWTPGYLVNRTWTADEMRAWITDYVTTMVTRFGASVSSWDVVNEAFNPDGTTKDCVWSRVLGLEYADVAFRAARAADPDALLFLNEYQAENPGGRKFAALERLAGDLVAAGAPIDGVGLQFHLFGTGPFQWQVEQSLSRIAALGLRARVTEMDVPMNFLDGADRLRQQAEVYASVAAACLRVPACERLTTWGFSDAWSYRGVENASLPWDTEYAAKPAWDALLRVLRTPAPAPGNRVPSAPGAPQASGDVASRAFTLSWARATDPDGERLTYTLEHRAVDGSIDWRPLVTGLQQRSYTFTAAKRERSGAWEYRVRASDRATDGPWSTDPALVGVGDGVAGGDEGDDDDATDAAPAEAAPSGPPPPSAPAPAPTPAPTPALLGTAPAALLAPAAPRPAAARAPLRTLRSDRRGRVRLAVRCPTAARRACRSRVTLTRLGRRLATGTLRAAPGRTATVTLTLTRAGRRLVRRGVARATVRVAGRPARTVRLTTRR